MKVSFGISADTTFSSATFRTLLQCGFSALEIDCQNLEQSENSHLLRESGMSISVRNLVPTDLFRHLAETPNDMLRYGFEELFLRHLSAAVKIHADAVSIAPDIDRCLSDSIYNDKIKTLIRSLSRAILHTEIPLFFHYRMDKRKGTTPQQLAAWLKELMLPDAGFLLEAIPDEEGLFPEELFRNSVKIIPASRAIWKLSAVSTAMLPANTSKVISILNTYPAVPENGVVRVFFSLSGQSLTTGAAEDLCSLLKPFIPATIPAEKYGLPYHAG